MSTITDRPQAKRPQPAAPTLAPTSRDQIVEPRGSAPQPPKLRRRPMLVAASVAIVIVGALTSAWAYSTSTSTEQVVAIRTDIAQGSVVQKNDLQLVRISLDPALDVVPADQVDTLVGQHAATELTAGTLMSRRAVTPTEVPAPGTSVVGLALGPGKLPASPLEVGDPVRVVATPGDQGEVTPSTIRTFSGVVVTVGQADANGETAVSVQIVADQAAEVAARSATGKVALLLDAGQR